MERTSEDVQRAWARVAGYALLAIIVFGLANIFLQRGIESTGQSILAHELRFRIALVCGFLMLNHDVLLAVALYGLLKRIDGPLALLGALWRFSNAIVLGVGVVAALTALALLGAKADPGPVGAGQAQDLAGPFLRMSEIASPIGLLFWSIGAAVHSYLLWRSRYIPRLLSGSYLAIAIVILLGCFPIMLSPGIGAVIDPWFVLPDLPIELAVALWLLIKGARIPPLFARI